MSNPMTVKVGDRVLVIVHNTYYGGGRRKSGR